MFATGDGIVAGKAISPCTETETDAGVRENLIEMQLIARVSHDAGQSPGAAARVRRWLAARPFLESTAVVRSSTPLSSAQLTTAGGLCTRSASETFGPTKQGPGCAPRRPGGAVVDQEIDQHQGDPCSWRDSSPKSGPPGCWQEPGLAGCSEVGGNGCTGGPADHRAELALA
jgi:hypothetical protein